jgi:uncharacterized protein (DUF1499 family)
MERLWLVPTYAILTLAAVGPLAAHFRVLPPLAGFGLLFLAILIGIVFGIGLAAAAAFATATNKSWRPRALRAAIVPLLVGLPPLALASFSKVPPIHDISTDLVDRLEFTPDVAAASMNKDPDPALRALVEEQQKQAYSDLAPAILNAPPADAFARAKATAESLPGWQVTNADSESGRIEATATSSFFHFVDDVVIRVRPEGAGSRIDMRSRSRVGQGDLGANAKRIHAFMSAFAKAG